MKRLFWQGRGHCIPDKRDLALNLSFVLHERSDSRAVQSAVRASHAHARALNRRGPDFTIPSTTIGQSPSQPTLWLTATIGLPHLLAQALDTSPKFIIVIDSDGAPVQQAPFFRATANLVLPGIDERTVGVAALILRPDRRTVQPVVAGIHNWPADLGGALRSIERLIQAHAGQWMPARALWDAPAESLLDREVY